MAREDGAGGTLSARLTGGMQADVISSAISAVVVERMFSKAMPTS